MPGKKIAGYNAVFSGVEVSPTPIPMRKLTTALLLMTFPLFGSEPGTFVEQPNVVGRIAEALVASKLDHLVPHTSQEGDHEFSYHLTSVSYLGTIEKGPEKFVLATALFLRSSAKGTDYPPPRGHGFLLCLSTGFRLIAHCRLDYADVRLDGTMLLRNGDVIGDFGKIDKATRTRGFLIDGDDVLPYPFADKLPDPNAPHAKQP